MKDSTLAQKMRVTAGVLYAVLSVYQMLTTHTVLLGATITNISMVWLAAVLLIPGAAVMSLWMFSGEEVFSRGVRRAVGWGTAIAIVFEFVTYTQQVNIINYTLAQWLPAIYNQQIALYGFLAVRLLLMVLAAFFVISAKESYDYKSTSKDKSDATPADVAAAAAATPAGELDKPLEVTTSDDERKKAEEALKKAEQAEETTAPPTTPPTA